jgi:hypothetical protein
MEIDMTRNVLSGVALAILASGFAHADEKFEMTSVRFERNVTDKDAEVMFEASTPGTGLATLKVVAPNGRTVVDFKAPDSKLGIRHVNLESPEPRNDGSLEADFPEGEYAFTGTTVSGATLRGKAVLTHKVPDTAAFIRPRPEQEGVPVKGLQIKWSNSKTWTACIVVIEQEETGRKISANLPGEATTFLVPDGFLTPDTEYKLAIGHVAGDGNASFVETSFTTAGKK